MNREEIVLEILKLNDIDLFKVSERCLTEMAARIKGKQLDGKNEEAKEWHERMMTFLRQATTMFLL